MANITLEQIDLIMERANVNYIEAKDALERANGDMLEALVLLEKESKIKPKAKVVDSTACKDGLKSLLNKLNTTRFILKKEQRTCIDLSMTVTLIGALITCPLSIIALVIAYCSGYRIHITTADGVEKDITSDLNFDK